MDGALTTHPSVSIPMFRRCFLAAFLFALVPLEADTVLQEGRSALLREDFDGALRSFRSLAEAGHSDGQVGLGLMYANGHGVLEDDLVAMGWFRRAAEQGDAIGQYCLGLMLANGAVVPPNEKDAAIWFRRAAEQGSTEAQVALGLAHMSGAGVKEDDGEAVVWLRKAAELDNAEAQIILGFAYATGEGVVEDDDLAVKWLLRANGRIVADRGEFGDEIATRLGAVGLAACPDPKAWSCTASAMARGGAQENLGFDHWVGEENGWVRRSANRGLAEYQFLWGLLHEEGVVAESNNSMAAAWYRKAAQQGFVAAQLKLAQLYAIGWGVRPDPQSAIEWLLAVTEQPHVEIQLGVAAMYGSGAGLPEDHRLAALWYRKAAEQGVAVAQRSLGLMYYHGEGVRQDYREAAKWFRRAAEQHDVVAQRRLGILYVIGDGVPEDFVQAYAWLNLAAARGDEAALEARSILRKRMTPQQVAEAQELARRSSRESKMIVSPEPTVRQEPIGSGSGVLIGHPGSIVTNHHVVDGCASVTVTRAGRSFEASVRAIDQTNDLALIEANPDETEVASFSSVPRPALGEAVTTAGYPLNGLLSNDLNVTQGNVSALSGLKDDATIFQITAPVQPGNSGGPLLDGSGNLIGIVKGKLNALGLARITGDIPQNVNFAIQGAVVRGFLDIHGVPYSRRSSDNDIAPEGIANLARGFTFAIHCWK